MEDVIRLSDQFYIIAESDRAAVPTRVLKQGETFAVFDRYGDICPVGLAENGLYHEGTRYLSHLSLLIGGERPLLLSSAIKADNALVAVDLTNLDVANDGGGGDAHIAIPRGTLHVSRVLVLWEGICYERLQVRNYSTIAITSRSRSGGAWPAHSSSSWVRSTTGRRPMCWEGPMPCCSPSTGPSRSAW